MLKHSQRDIQNQINTLTQQTTAARWYNSQLATKLPSGRPNSTVRTVATTPGLPWEPEMTAEQAAYVRTILREKNILPTTGASLSNQLFNVSHPPENLKIHPLDPPKSQILTFQQTQVLAMLVPGEQHANPNPVFIAYRRDFYSQAPTGPYLSVPPKVVKSDILTPPGRLGRRPVANIRTSGRTQRPRGKTAFTGGLR